jgi:flagellar basal-body rod protein FlgG
MDLLLSQVRMGFAGADRTLSVYADQVANANTAGFQALDPYSQALPDAPVNQAVTTSVGATVLTERSTAEGAFEPTGSPLDAAIDGPGYFAVEEGGRTFYTRLGAFQVDGQGRLTLPGGGLVLGVNGRPLTVPAGATGVAIAGDGTVTAVGASGQPVTVGRIGVWLFRNPEGLAGASGTLVTPTANSGAPALAASASLRTGVLEGSNVDLARALVGLLQAAEAFRAQAEMATVDNTMQSRLDQLVS